MSIINIHTTTSTNDTLKAMLKQQVLDNYTTLSAQFQTSGRGEQSNIWVSNRGENLLFSTLVKHEAFAVTDAFKLNEMVSLAITDVLKRYFNGILIKWPNDILADSLKIAGILIENVVKGTHIAYSIVGVGLNVNQIAFEGLENKAVSLKQLMGKTVDLEPLLRAIISRYKYYFKLLDHSGLHEQYMRNLYGYQQFLTYQTKADKVFKGQIVKVEHSGLLVIEDERGVRRTFDRKEIALLY